MPRDGRGKDESDGEISLCANSLLPLVPPNQSQGLTDVEFPPVRKGTFSTLEEWKGKFPQSGTLLGVAGFAGLLSDWADFNPLSRAQGEDRGWVREKEGEWEK